MKQLLALLVMVLTSFVIAGCGGGSSDNGGGQQGPLSTTDHEVEMMEFNQYSPDRIEIQAGDTVRWVNVSDDPHTVTGSDFDSGTLTNGQSYSHTFTVPGTVNYRCRLHSGMTGTIIVQ
jgi:plastocyanin